MKKILFACAIVIALAAGVFVHFRFDPLGSYAYADPPPPIASPP